MRCRICTNNIARRWYDKREELFFSFASIQRRMIRWMWTLKLIRHYFYYLPQRAMMIKLKFKYSLWLPLVILHHYYRYYHHRYINAIVNCVEQTPMTRICNWISYLVHLGALYSRGKADKCTLLCMNCTHTSHSIWKFTYAFCSV